MRKADLMRGLANMAGLSRREAAVVVDTMLAVIKEALQRGESVQIVGFGRFTVRRKRARMGRHVRTGEAILIRARSMVSFRASTSLRRLINRRRA
jgi:nucleoid DNA-binding protein